MHSNSRLTVLQKHFLQILFNSYMSNNLVHYILLLPEYNYGYSHVSFVYPSLISPDICTIFEKCYLTL